MTNHAIFINGGATPTVVQPSTHTWRPTRGDVPWEIRTGYEPYRAAGTVIERHTPARRPERPKPQTAWAGSWAQQETDRRMGRAAPPIPQPQWPIGHWRHG